MLGVLCARPKPWIPAWLSLAHSSAAAHHHRLSGSPTRLVGYLGGGLQHRRHHSSSCRLGNSSGSRVGAALIWHAILPSSGGYRRPAFHHEQMKGEGSWNVAWDARPARWLHRSDSAWLLFGVCACLAAPLEYTDVSPEAVAISDNAEGRSTDIIVSERNDESSANYRVTGVTADGRCLFRAIAHVSCLRNGEEAPDENRQKELADDLRALVVDELLKRRKETEWFIEGDFDAYVKRIQQPYVWGGEPELLMASHVFKFVVKVPTFKAHSISESSVVADLEREREREWVDGRVVEKLAQAGYCHSALLDQCVCCFLLLLLLLCALEMLNS